MQAEFLSRLLEVENSLYAKEMLQGFLKQFGVPRVIEEFLRVSKEQFKVAELMSVFGSNSDFYHLFLFSQDLYGSRLIFKYLEHKGNRRLYTHPAEG